MSLPRSFLHTLRSTLRTNLARPSPQQNLRSAFQRRAQTTATETPPAPAETQGGFAKLWNSPVGPKTVHFWAPVMKWGVALAGASDFFRPAEALSLQQNLALMATGMIWTRWCFVIRPKNILLATVNVLLFCVGGTQVTRVLLYQRANKNETIGEQVKEAVQDEAGVVKGVVEDPKGAAKKAGNS